MNPVPEFGSALPGRSYELRPGAYAVLRNFAGHIAVVLTPRGSFLPGGGQEPGESLEEALRREVLEECGLEIELGARIGVADELVFSREEARYFRKRGTFFEAYPRQLPPVQSLESEHIVLWLPVADALERFSHESHRWAVRAFQAR